MHRRLEFALWIVGIVGLLIASVPSRGATSVLSYHNDSSSSGINSTETILTPAKLTTSTFSKLYATAVDGQVYAQPLYVPGVTVTGGPQAGKHNLVIVATENDSLYGIDADSGTVVWQDSFLATGLPGATSITAVPEADTNSALITPILGITGTPVIDGTTNMLYVVANTKQIISGATYPSYTYTMYKIDITNGNATANANIVSSNLFAVTIWNGQLTGYTYRTNTNPSAPQDPFVLGWGDGSGTTVGGEGRLYLNAKSLLNRGGLTLSGGIVYVPFASHGDRYPFEGWLLGFKESDLSITSVNCTSPLDGGSGLWNSGGCPVVDSGGNIYVMTGNGTFDGNNTAGVTGLNAQGFPANGDYGDSMIKLAVDSTTTAASQNTNGWGLKILDYFTPAIAASLGGGDADFGCGGPVLLPTSVSGTSGHGQLLVGGSKRGAIYLIDTTNLGKYGVTDANVQTATGAIGGCFSTPVFFNGILYYCGENDHVKAFSLSNATLSAMQFESSDTFTFPGSTPSLSANGTSNAILWTINYNSGTASILRAYNPTPPTPPSTTMTEIWNSTLAANSRDALGNEMKFNVPTVADGHVFVGTDSALVTYGLSSVAPLLTSGAPPNGAAYAPYIFNFTATGAPYPTFNATGTLPTGLTLSPTGTLSGTPSIGGLFTGTVTASNGVNPAVTQNFSITITNTYANWVTQENLTGNQALPTAIVSSDGLTNLMIYALGLNPFTVYNPGSSSLPQVQVQKFSGVPYLTLTFTPAATDVTYKVQASSDLVNWSTLQTYSGVPLPGTVTVQDSQATSASSVRFMRLQVSQ